MKDDLSSLPDLSNFRFLDAKIIILSRHFHYEGSVRLLFNSKNNYKK